MEMSKRLTNRWLGVALLLVCAGCGGGDTGVPTVPVNGVLLVDGQPAEGVSVMCMAAGATPDASGVYPIEAGCQTGPDGSFILNKFSEKPGLPKGDYALTFVWLKMIDSPQASLADKDYLNKLYNSLKKAPHKFTVAEESDIDLGQIQLASTRKKK